MSRKPRPLFRSLLLFAVLVVAGLGLWIAATWDSYPGGYLKNRLNLDGAKLSRAEECRDDFLREHPDLAAGELSLVVSKSSRRIALLSNGREVWNARIGLGGVAEGHKQREGDRRTPEGDYYICTRNPESRFHLFLGISYPNTADAEQGLRDGRISREQYERIARADRARKCPPWKTALGGEVGIHGSGSTCDWTLGCIALDDSDVELLWALCPIGTPVRIDP
jgi:hypothetical protein